MHLPLSGQLQFPVSPAALARRKKRKTHRGADTLGNSPQPNAGHACFPVAHKGLYHTLLNPAVFVAPELPASQSSKLAPEAPNFAMPAPEMPCLLLPVPEVPQLPMASAPEANQLPMASAPEARLPTAGPMPKTLAQEFFALWGLYWRVMGVPVVDSLEAAPLYRWLQGEFSAFTHTYDPGDM